MQDMLKQYYQLAQALYNIRQVEQEPDWFDLSDVDDDYL